jgi:hypothetical protein
MTMSAICARPPGFRTRAISRNGGGLVWHEVEHAIGDHDVDGRVVQWEARRIAITDFNVRQP